MNKYVLTEFLELDNDSSLLTEDDKTSSPSIFIRNVQNPELDKKPIGELVEEDFMKDGSSFYMTSKKVKIKFSS